MLLSPLSLASQFTYYPHSSILIVPIAVYDPIFRAVNKNDPSNEHFYEARAISFAIFLGVALFFWVPILVWKGIGKAQMKRVLASYEKYDQMMKRHATFIPKWEATTPSLFASQVVSNAFLVPAPQSSNFFPSRADPQHLRPSTSREYPHCVRTWCTPPTGTCHVVIHILVLCLTGIAFVCSTSLLPLTEAHRTTTLTPPPSKAMTGSRA